ncbi:MAG TPA: hypothetical protein VGB45_03715 [Abditibacterium sp.]
MKRILILSSVLLAFNVQSQAQNAPTRANSNGGVSLAAYLQLQNKQTDKLARFSDDFAVKREQHRAKISWWHSEQRRAQKDGNERAAMEIERDIEAEELKTGRELQAIRAKALQILPPVQRSQLEFAGRDPRLNLRRDEWYQLLISPVDDFAPTTMLSENARRSLDKRDSRRDDSRRNDSRSRGGGSYGVYGGYYGRPDVGVYGNYGVGGVGVHAGIGRNGPTIGVGIGRVFGGRR